MLTQDPAGAPHCVVCGSAGRCDQPALEGAIVGIERRAHTGPQGTIQGVRILLHGPDGLARLDLGERFAYLAEGLAALPKGLALRACHLRRARLFASGDGRHGAAPAFLSGPETLVVLEPDWLVDVTALTGTEYCLRQWLANRLASRPGTLQQLRGTVVHGCFETLCRDGDLPEDRLTALADHAVYHLALQGASTESLLAEVQPHLPRLRRWHAQFGAELLGGQNGEPCFESTILCPELGLRGRVDLALRRRQAEGPPLVTRIVELKTGKYNERWPDPAFQVRGYYAMLASQQRLAQDFQAQVIYTGGAEAVCRQVDCGPEHLDHIAMRRNQAVLAQLAGYAPQSSAVNRCRHSSGRADCVRLSTLLGLNHCQGRDLQDAATEAADPLDTEFYATQYRLLRLEAQATSHELAALWRCSPSERENAGTAIVPWAEIDRRRDAGGWHWRLRCRNASELRLGDTVLLSDGDPIRGEVAVGSLTQVGAEAIEVVTSEPLDHPTLVDSYQSAEASDRTLRGLHAWMSAPAAYRARLYGTCPPRFAPPASEQTPHPAQDLNPAQADALDRALRCRDFLLVQGPPGTGKTHLIAAITRALVARGERMLLAAWTNQAVDTMARALLAQEYGQFLRLGSPRAIDQSVLPFAVAELTTGPEALAESLRTIPVLVGTVSAFADQRLTPASLRRDIVILDEAAQLSVASSVGVLRLAPRFILVGDDQQLPPVVRSEDAAREGLSLSPFALLRPEAQAHGALVPLTVQYRMHQAIAAWPNEAFYAGLLTAHPSVADHRLPQPNRAAPGGAAPGAIADRERPIVLVDTGTSAIGETEQAAAAAHELLRGGVPAADIGIVAPFRATVAAIRRLLDGGPAGGCTVDTVDRFQGGQREVMIVCLGLSGWERRTHAFVDDPRRLNVAFTRARAKLIVIGDLQRAASLPTLAGFLQHCLDSGMTRIDRRGERCDHEEAGQVQALAAPIVGAAASPADSW